MTTIAQSTFSINGVLDTNQSVLDNLNTICTAAGCWLSYDVATGKWAVTINRAGTSVKSFNNSNIIGGINITGKGINEAYNKVSIEFPHKDLRDQIDYIDLSIPSADLYPNEIDNTLTMKIDCVNDPIQAEYIASVELKQNRVDRIIEFRTDYSVLGLKAGDLIDVTEDMYGFTNKMFRIIKVTEDDKDDGTIELAITALEYDAAVYDSSTLNREFRSKNTGIITQPLNQAVQTSNDQATGASLVKLLGITMLSGLLKSGFSLDKLTGKVTQTIEPADAKVDSILKNIKSPPVRFTATNACRGSNIVITATQTCTSCLHDNTQFPYSYTITGVTESDIDFPLKGDFTISGTKTFTIPAANNANGAKTLTFTVTGAASSISTTAQIYAKLPYTYVTTASPTTIMEGETSTVTLTTTGVANGTSIPYVITGSATGKVTTPLTGDVVVNNNTATLAIVTTDDTVYTGPQTLLITFNKDQVDSCGQLDKTAAITVNDNDTAPPTPPADTTCQTIDIPVVWCPTYDGTTGNVKSIAAIGFATVQAPITGGPTIDVPATVSVTVGNPSVVTVLTYHTIDATANKPGQDFKVITGFNSIPQHGLVTGTTTTVTGF